MALFIIVKTLPLGFIDEGKAAVCELSVRQVVVYLNGDGLERSLSNTMDLSIGSFTSRKVGKLSRNVNWNGEKIKKPLEEAIIHSAKDFCFNSVLHGVKYLAEPKRPNYERFAWSMILTGFVAVALYLLWETSLSGLSNPLLINLESSNHPINEFTFPAVTICPNTKLNRTVAEWWVRNAHLPPHVSESYLYEILPGLLHLIDFADSPELETLQEVLDINNITAHHLYLNLSIQCRDLLLQCTLQSIIIPCEELFKTIRSTDGYCCSFNYFGVSNQFNLNLFHKPSLRTPEAPLKLSSSGKDGGLSVAVVSKGDRFGALMSSFGVKVLLHEPNNFPDHLVNERLVQPEHSEQMSIVPSLIFSGPELRQVDPSLRNCFFYNEKSLSGFQGYSYKNCIFNCRIEFFVKLCGCVPFYYPGHEDNFRTCTLRDVPCLSRNKNQIQVLRQNISVDLKLKESAPCGCRPQCNELYYEVATSTFPLFSELTQKKLLGFKADTENYSVLHVYFKAMFGTKYARIEHSTSYQMLANFGGLLGLFVGFSFIAGFEVVYSFTIRVFFHMHLAKKAKKSDQFGLDIE